MNTNAYLSFLAIGIVLVLIDGQVIYRSGRGYLENSYGDAGAGASMTRLVTVLFHLVALGLLALLSTIPLGTVICRGWWAGSAHCCWYWRSSTPSRSVYSAASAASRSARPW